MGDPARVRPPGLAGLLATEQVFQVGGALALLAAFGAAQVGWLDVRSLAYLALNLAGSVVLAVVAAVDRDWGFLLLETVWAAVTLVGLVRRLGAGPPPPQRLQ